jgi:hypothetical protein
MAPARAAALGAWLRRVAGGPLASAAGLAGGLRSVPPAPACPSGASAPGSPRRLPPDRSGRWDDNSGPRHVAVSWPPESATSSIPRWSGRYVGNRVTAPGWNGRSISSDRFTNGSTGSRRRPVRGPLAARSLAPRAQPGITRMRGRRPRPIVGQNGRWGAWPVAVPGKDRSEYPWNENRRGAPLGVYRGRDDGCPEPVRSRTACPRGHPAWACPGSRTTWLTGRGRWSGPRAARIRRHLGPRGNAGTGVGQQSPIRGPRLFRRGAVPPCAHRPVLASPVLASPVLASPVLASPVLTVSTRATGAPVPVTAGGPTVCSLQSGLSDPTTYISTHS